MTRYEKHDVNFKSSKISDNPDIPTTINFKENKIYWTAIINSKQTISMANAFCMPHL